MQKAYELPLWKIRDGDDAQSAISTRYHSREGEGGREETERERGGKETDIFPIQIQMLFKIKIKKPNPPGPKKSALRCRYPE